MLASERHEKIVEILNREGSVLVKDLSKKFDVTQDSIRKDLTILERKGLLKKTYGGAVKVRTNIHYLYVSQRIGKFTKEKNRIAEKALSLIEEGDVIFLDISTANIELVKLIVQANLKITIVTNMIDVMLTFTSPVDTKLVFLGGTLSRGRDGFVGTLTNNQIKEFRFDKAFMGSAGVDLEKDCVYTYAVDDAMTKKAIMEASNKSYVMLENRKFSIDGNYRYSTVGEFEGFILDSKPEKEIKENIERYGIQWFA